MEYVLFESAGLIKDGLIREWDRLSGDDVKGLRAYLLAYVTAAPTMSNYVRERIVQVIAIIVKRQSIDDMGVDRRQVLEEVKQLIVGGNMQVSWKSSQKQNKLLMCSAVKTGQKCMH